MPRVVSFIVLLAVILLIGSMFFEVMVQFIVPLFLAAVLVVVFKPLHEWMFRRCGPRPRLVAALTTLAIVVIVLLPLSWLLVKAISEGTEITAAFVGPSSPGSDTTPQREPSTQGEPVAGDAPTTETVNDFLDKILTEVNSLLEKIGLSTVVPKEQVIAYATESIGKVAAPLALGGVKMLASTLMGLAIMVLTMYYFFADGPGMVEAIMRLSPMDDAYERELLDKFSDISRAVVVATLASAVVQGTLAGVGYYFAGTDKVFFLTALTIILSMVPFVGATIVWAPFCAWLHFIEGDTTTAVVLLVYCLTVVSMVDNLIKPLVLHGQANLHPLLALLSVIGGVQALGPIGILVGPMLVAFLQALLNMLNKELELLGHQEALAGATATLTEQPAQNQPSQRKRKNKRKK